jgi:hypothetical protein
MGDSPYHVAALGRFALEMNRRGGAPFWNVPRPTTGTYVLPFVQLTEIPLAVSVTTRLFSPEA